MPGQFAIGIGQFLRQPRNIVAEVLNRIPRIGIVSRLLALRSQHLAMQIIAFHVGDCRAIKTTPIMHFISTKSKRIKHETIRALQLA
ncbi:hypothetical protein WL32_23535 [Burkholderia cepacia]|uniref:hypothetical protein n=1 Tax=Burkholderia cepacia TaxID=292 RepID=UPI00075F53FA|nr:hypothetical protein [Burkholderia cepacia]KWB18160.1 hypothetical protein WL32_23535 [Burkholderia cepacia]